jgi:hypothetical protein
MDNPELDPRQGEFSGFSSGRAHLIVAHFTYGKAQAIYPQLPPLGLRRRYKWIRALRSFIIFYRPGTHVTLVEVFDSAGRLIHRAYPNGYGFFS